MKKRLLVGLWGIMLCLTATACGSSTAESKVDPLTEKIEKLGKTEAYEVAIEACYGEDLVSPTICTKSDVYDWGDGTYTVSCRVVWTVYPDKKCSKSVDVDIALDENGEPYVVE